MLGPQYTKVKRGIPVKVNKQTIWIRLSAQEMSPNARVLLCSVLRGGCSDGGKRKKLRTTEKGVQVSLYIVHIGKVTSAFWDSTSTSIRVWPEDKQHYSMSNFLGNYTID